MPLDQQYQPDQFEMARRALVASATPDGSVNVATGPEVGASPFLYGRAKPKTPLEQQMEREQQRQLREQQRYDALQAELTTVPQWAADRMGPAAAMQTRQRGAQVAAQQPRPAGTPLADAFARSEQDFANIPRAGEIARSEGDLDAEATAMRFFSPNQVIMRTRQQQEAANAPARQADQRFELVGNLLRGMFSSNIEAPSWEQVQSVLQLAGMSLPEAGPQGGAPAVGGMGDGITTMADVQREAAEDGVPVEVLLEEYRRNGIPVR